MFHAFLALILRPMNEVPHTALPSQAHRPEREKSRALSSPPSIGLLSVASEVRGDLTPEKQNPLPLTGIWILLVQPVGSCCTDIRTSPHYAKPFSCHRQCVKGEVVVAETSFITKGSTSEIQSCVHQALLATCFMLVFCLAYSLTLKMVATCSSETSVDFQ
jgi:hypothetical protein